MVRTGKDELHIIIPTTAPETLLYDLLKDIPHILQALQCMDVDFVDDQLPGCIFTLLELYKSLLPPNELAVEAMIKHVQGKPTSNP